tara:strand:- start:337 stop:885 length:549 start_codon:yes stop_codon:yes gene_type:complete
MMNALKEWATVVKALEQGTQTVLLRKGGILDDEFDVEVNKFFLFPTWRHHETKYVRPEHQNFLEEMINNRPENGFNKITSFAEVLDEQDVGSMEVIERLSEFHVWSKTYIEERAAWKPEKPFKAIFLKTYKIPDMNIPLESSFAGCKSWLEINSNFELGESVLTESEIQSRLTKFRDVVSEI